MTRAEEDELEVVLRLTHNPSRAEDDRIRQINNLEIIIRSKKKTNEILSYYIDSLDDFYEYANSGNFNINDMNHKYSACFTRIQMNCLEQQTGNPVITSYRSKKTYK